MCGGALLRVARVLGNVRVRPPSSPTILAKSLAIVTRRFCPPGPSVAQVCGALPRYNVLVYFCIASTSLRGLQTSVPGGSSNCVETVGIAVTKPFVGGSR